MSRNALSVTSSKWRAKRKGNPTELCLTPKSTVKNEKLTPLQSWSPKCLITGLKRRSRICYCWDCDCIKGYIIKRLKMTRRIEQLIKVPTSCKPHCRRIKYRDALELSSRYCSHGSRKPNTTSQKRSVMFESLTDGFSQLRKLLILTFQGRNRVRLSAPMRFQFPHSDLLPQHWKGNNYANSLLIATCSVHLDIADYCTPWTEL
jgi:hypothetical protein